MHFPSEFRGFRLQNSKQILEERRRVSVDGALKSVDSPFFGYCALSVLLLKQWRTQKQAMVWSSEVEAADGEAWIAILLGSFDGDLLELELDVDGQRFFDDMERLLAEHQEREPDGLCNPRQATNEAVEWKTETSRPFCTLLEDTQIAIGEAGQEDPRRRAATSARYCGGRQQWQPLTDGTREGSTTQIDAKPKRASTPRKKLNRRLF
ncbi:hypothetical protein BBJ28_00015681 [Nothophytophthora sp. Chile5]|nr:hypothetical protein BBJ28_00015681 [Nothophytophthora sp. Chile5]